MDGKQLMRIVGSGVVGLGTGWRLAEAGLEVHIHDKGEIGHGASWAAAGLLAANIQDSGDELSNFQTRSLEMWPAFAAEIEQGSGLSVGYRNEGTLIGAFDRNEASQLQALASARADRFTWQDAGEARRREPHFAKSLSGALFSWGDHQVDNRALTAALAAAARRSGAQLLPDNPVEAVIERGGKVRAVRCEGDDLAADLVLIAAGAWSSAIAGLPAVVPVHPVKGEMVALRMDAEAPMLSHVVWGPGVYLVPRRSGRLVIGATTLDQGFDSSLSAGGVLQLLAAAAHTMPGLMRLPIEETWTGFRPTSKDHLPMIGATEVDGLYVATGLGHNGILMSAATIRAMSALILTGDSGVNLRAFSPGRFST